jgi:hypothetical protein
MFINLFFPTTTIVVPNVSVLRTQAMNPNIGHTIVPINYHTIRSQPITSIILGTTNMLPISTYPMWYNIIPPFVPLDPNLYLVYPTRTKGITFSIFRNYTCYVFEYVHLTCE